MSTPPLSGRERWSDAPQTALARATQSIRNVTESEGLLSLVIVPAALLAICLYLAFSTSSFGTSANLTDILVQASVLAIVSFGLTLVILTGELDLSVGSGTALASVVSAMVMRDSHSVALGVLAGLGCGIGLGLLNGLLVTQLKVPSFIATLGTLEVARGVALALTNGQVIGSVPQSVSGIANNQFLGLRWPIWITAVVFVVLYLLLRRTTFGVGVMSVGGNREASRLSSIPVNRVRIMTFVITGLCVGIAGVITTARVQSGQPNTGSLLALTAIAAIVVGGTSIFGGRGSMTRTLWGVLLLSVVQNGLDLKGVSDDMKQVVIGLVFIAAASTDFLRRRLRRRRSLKESLAAGVGPPPDRMIKGEEAA